jgi:hypothetical protein
MMHNDAAFEALADGQRRGLLIELLESGRYHVPELSSSSQEIAEANQRFLREYLSTDQESNAGDKELIRMHVVHIPKLAGDRFIEWDRHDYVATKGPRFDELVPVLELVDELRDDRPVADAVITLKQ